MAAAVNKVSNGGEAGRGRRTAKGGASGEFVERFNREPKRC